MKENPVRIQRSRKYKQVSPNGLPIVYVGRPSKWGNPHKAGVPFKIPYHVRIGVTAYIDSETKPCHAVDFYDCDLINGKLAFSIEDVKRELKGKNLSCWCKIGEPCHADILLKIANQ